MMQRWLAMAWCLVFVAGCATPAQIKEASRRQGELLDEFRKTTGTLRSRLFEYYDARIEEFRQPLIAEKLRHESMRVTAALESDVQAISIEPDLSQTQKGELIRRYLNQASNYLIQLRQIYFNDRYCEDLKRLQPEFLKPPDEGCDDRHVKVYKKLRQGRDQVAQRFDHLAASVADMQEAHALIDRFLQSEFKLTRERVDAAKNVIQQAKETVEDAKKVFERVRQPGL